MRWWKTARCVFKNGRGGIITESCATKRILKNIPTESFWQRNFLQRCLQILRVRQTKSARHRGFRLGGHGLFRGGGDRILGVRKLCKDFPTFKRLDIRRLGRIDLTGKQLAEALYTRVAFGLDTIRMAVVPADDYKDPIRLPPGR